MRTVLAICASAMTLAACGQSAGNNRQPARSPEAPKSKTSTQVALPPNIITDSVIAKQPKDSPSAALLRWWQAVQFQDTSGVRALTSETTAKRFGAARLTKLARTIGPALGGLEIIGADVRGDAATVRAVVVTYRAGSNSPASSLPVSFAMHRNGASQWEFAEDSYLRALARGYGVRQ